MQILKNKTNIDFIGKRKPAIFISTVLNVAILVGIAVFGFNFGVDFAGGTMVEVKFNHPITAAEVRQRAEKGLPDVSVQSIGDADENAFLLRLGGVTQLTEESAVKARAAIEALGPVRSIYPDLANGIINFRAEQSLTAEQVEQAVEASGTGVEEVRVLGAAQAGGFDYQVVASGMADLIRSTLMTGVDPANPDFEMRRVEYVGPQIGKQLRNRGIMALLYSMVAILIYVAFRFDFKFGPGALLAMLHDVVMVAGFYLVTRAEFNLTAIAALLTVVGYSVNDTIVIYDRIREDMAKFQGKPLAEVINIAVNETLVRTIITSGTTALSLIGLLIFAVGEIRDFAWAMLVGIAVGVYSTIYIASPLTIWLDERAAAREAREKGMKPQQPTTA